MNNENTSPWGARIERGRIAAITTDELGTDFYTVESIDRPGVTGYGLTLINETLDPPIGASVYFFMFDDGTGQIMSQIT